MDCNIYRKYELPESLFEDSFNHKDWYYGVKNKSHYLVNNLKNIIGCLNLIFLSIYKDTYLFYLDTIEIKENYRRCGLGTKLMNFLIDDELGKYSKYNLFLLVSFCDQKKLSFFGKLGFLPTKLRMTKLGTHCVMSYPRDEYIEENCNRFFEYFNWKAQNKRIISSDCKFAYYPNPTGLYWCAKKKIYVSGIEKQNCKFYIKEKEVFTEKELFKFKIDK